MSQSGLTFASSSGFRNTLMNRNLPPYSVQGVYTPAVSNRNYETVFNNFSVIDSPNNLLGTPYYANQNIPINEYGPNEGTYFNTNINDRLPIDPNKGEYDPNDTQLDLVNEFFIDAAYIENKYGPQGGYENMIIIDSIQNNNKLYIPYWTPPSFVPSSYAPYQILTSSQPNGSNGSLSQDSYMIKIGSDKLKNLFQDRINTESKFNTTSGFKITISDETVTQQSFINRISETYFPSSPIPGNYFDFSQFNGGAPNQLSGALNTTNPLTGGAVGGQLNTTNNPSLIFLEYTGDKQKSILFDSIDFNLYKPNYDENGNYYVGSVDSDPSTITSPPNQVPVDSFGRQVQAPVYGPAEMGILYEGNVGKINFGLGAESFSNNGNIDGQFIWTSPKYKSNAGYKATPGGGNGSVDPDFNIINSQYRSNESTNIQFKQSSILDETQRLINSADNVSGIARLKHVGNAINQVSKVFNDGYKELTKGSKVLSYRDNTNGTEAGIEYCRVFTKDTPYYTYNDLQKVDGITKSGRRFADSVFDNTFNLNIVPLRNPGSTNIVPNSKGQLIAKKYMFSIENLAWRTSSKPGLTYDDLPACERGPNGGRVMWFPPYDLTFSDSSTPNFTPTSFLGRPEPIYTYNNTSRSGSISWTIIVDHPSAMNTIIEKQLKDIPKERVDSIINSFFAGCVKYDIYTLAKKYNQLSPSELFTFQEVLNNPRLTREELEGVTKQIQVEATVPNSSGNDIQGNNSGGPKIVETEDPSKAQFETDFKELAFYFDNDIPGPPDASVKTSNKSYDETYDSYISLKGTYKTQSESLFGAETTFCKKQGNVFTTKEKKGSFDTKKTHELYCTEARPVVEFLDTVVTSNFDKVKNKFVSEAYDIIQKGGTITIEMEGSASALGLIDYNKSLSDRRVDSVKKFFDKYKSGDKSLSEAFKTEKIKILNVTTSGEEKVIPKGEGNNLLGFEVDCKLDVQGGYGSQIYSVYAMACRRVVIKTIKVENLPKIKTTIEGNTDKPDPPKTIEKRTVPYQPPRLQPRVDVIKKIKDGISKKILRNLFSECDYFQVLEKENPMVYQSIKDKIKYFSPAFHSMTPEGLNARLVFLNQCVRPGETIPTIDIDGKPKYNDAVNTSFGAPPILVLRIGDFYHTKIVPTNLSFNYDPKVLDLNPEGIGIQPMMVKVTLGFNMIGGHGLSKPIDELQNALSFNYYANTEIYDERATPTDKSYEKLDKEVVDSILAGQTPATTNSVTNQQTNDGGDTIGEIQTNIPIPNGQSGETSFMKIMDSYLTNTITYMNTVVNQMEKLVLSYNHGILQLVNDKRKYTNVKYYNGNSNPPSIKESTEIIWGQPDGDDVRLKTLFENNLNYINDNSNPIVTKMKDKFAIGSPQLNTLKLNLKKYVENLSKTFSNGIVETYNGIYNFEITYAQIIRKISLVCSSTDGKLLEGGRPRVYNLAGTSGVSPLTYKQQDRTIGTDPTTKEELYNDFNNSFTVLKDYNKPFLENTKITTMGLYQGGNFDTIIDGIFNGKEEKVFFLIMSRIITDKNKKQQFIDSLLTGDLKSNNKFKKLLNDVIDDLDTKYTKELNAEEKIFKDLRKNKTFKEYVDSPDTKFYPKGKPRKFTYSTIPSTRNSIQETDIKNLYAIKPNPLEF